MNATTREQIVTTALEPFLDIIQQGLEGLHGVPLRLRHAWYEAERQRQKCKQQKI